MLKLNYSGYTLEAGTDEAGRGCLSGPVVAAAVILPADFSHPFLNDSKQSLLILRDSMQKNNERLNLAIKTAKYNDSLRDARFDSIEFRDNVIVFGDSLTLDEIKNLVPCID